MSSLHLNLARMLFAVDGPGEGLGLFAIAAGDGEFVFALLAVPNDHFAAEGHGDFDFADVGGNLVSHN
jgi:hypothetical protein